MLTWLYASFTRGIKDQKLWTKNGNMTYTSFTYYISLSESITVPNFAGCRNEKTSAFCHALVTHQCGIVKKFLNLYNGEWTMQFLISLWLSMHKYTGNVWAGVHCGMRTQSRYYRLLSLVLSETVTPRCCNLESKWTLTFCTQLEKAVSQIDYMIRQAYGDKTMGESVVFKWLSCFSRGQQSLEDNLCKKRPMVARNKSNAWVYFRVVSCQQSNWD
jgi:hypothetical protein